MQIPRFPTSGPDGIFCLRDDLPKFSRVASVGRGGRAWPAAFIASGVSARAELITSALAKVGGCPRIVSGPLRAQRVARTTTRRRLPVADSAMSGAIAPASAEDRGARSLDDMDFNDVFDGNRSPGNSPQQASNAAAREARLARDAASHSPIPPNARDPSPAARRAFAHEPQASPRLLAGCGAARPHQRQRAPTGASLPARLPRRARPTPATPGRRPAVVGPIGPRVSLPRDAKTTTGFDSPTSNGGSPSMEQVWAAFSPGRRLPDAGPVPFLPSATPLPAAGVGLIRSSPASVNPIRRIDSGLLHNTAPVGRRSRDAGRTQATHPRRFRDALSGGTGARSGRCFRCGSATADRCTQ